jgi:hydrogenase maturation protease
MAAVRILCIGNRFVAGDDFGPRVYDTLTCMKRPADVEIVDGGLAGLNLLRYLENGKQVVFVDAVSGFAPIGEITVIDGDIIARQATGKFGHEAGLPFLLRILPAVVDNPPPRIRLVGCEGTASEGAVLDAARLSLRLALEAM